MIIFEPSYTIGIDQSGFSISVGGGVGGGADDLLLEIGDHLLLETGDALLLE